MTDKFTPALEALLNYQQADMDGIMVTTFRQAIHEVADEYASLKAINAELLEALEHASDAIASGSEAQLAIAEDAVNAAIARATGED